MLTRIRRQAWKAVSLATICSLLGVIVALAASGDLDNTFSGNGKQTTKFAAGWEDYSLAVALQTDGKIVAVGASQDPGTPGVGDFAVARYNTNGNLDTTFSGDGKVTTNFGGMDQASGIAIQADGRIVVSGRKCVAPLNCDLAVARYNTNGTPDSTFSGDGKQVIGYGGGDNGSYGGIAIQPDGRIVIAGYMINSSGNRDFAVYRLNANGSPDSTFSGNGRHNFGFGSGRLDEAEDLLLSGTKIVVAGYTCDATDTNCNFAVAQLTSSGALDSGFSGDGKQLANFGADDFAYAMALAPDDKIVVVGDRYAPAGDHFAVARFEADGDPDLTFSSNGKQTVTFNDSAWAEDVVVEGDGTVVVAGNGLGNGSRDFALIRLTPGGSLDNAFSGNGKANFNFAGTNSDNCYAMALQADGKYLLAGSTRDATQSFFGLMRVLP